MLIWWKVSRLTNPHADGGGKTPEKIKATEGEKMTAKYMVSIRYNGVWKDYYFNTKKEARDFMYRQEIKGCNLCNMKIQQIQ